MQFAAAEIAHSIYANAGFTKKENILTNWKENILASLLNFKQRRPEWKRADMCWKMKMKMKPRDDALSRQQHHFVRNRTFKASIEARSPSLVCLLIPQRSCKNLLSFQKNMIDCRCSMLLEPLALFAKLSLRSHWIIIIICN